MTSISAKANDEEQNADEALIFTREAEKPADIEVWNYGSVGKIPLEFIHHLNDDQTSFRQMGRRVVHLYSEEIQPVSARDPPRSNLKFGITRHPKSSLYTTMGMSTLATHTRQLPSNTTSYAMKKGTICI